jgi:ABC-type cobalamin/Fe3+-siderophores transport system ATPase subunit
MAGMMRLVKFRVRDFRSVEDSGWITVDDVTALIGINESGKTNLLLPLWKLNPAKDGEINLVADAPRKRYSEIKNLAQKPVFVEAHFELPDDLVAQLVAMTGATAEDVRVTSVSRRLDGTHLIGFPNAEVVRAVPRDEIVPVLEQAQEDIRALEPATKVEDGLKEAMEAAIASVIGLAAGSDDDVGQGSLKAIADRLGQVDLDGAAKRSTLEPRFGQLVDAVDELLARASKPAPWTNAEARKLVLSRLPSFVYYSNYGNLDSEIYLPHVIENLERDDLGSREEAKARTLKVLFEFVRLSAKEILELGRDLPQTDEEDEEPTDEEIEAVAARKKEREILLQSASTELTQRFRDWWKQGDYRIRFNADGDHFRIWVSDDQRPEEIELEGRSTGLQWFLSFYLIFLVESADAHQGAILLLDEPGLSLHPLAQKDLSLFFDNLSQTNQLIYTTHSPFLVDANHLDRVRSVYIDERGATVASPDLRASESDRAQTKAIYAVHAALGLATSDIILQGCQPIIVEGPSDQFYLNAVKNYLIRSDLINPKRELVFVPAGGVRGVSAVVSILTAKDEALPFVVLDSDRSGEDMANKLKGGLYKGADDRILMAGDFCQMPGAEVEDLLPPDLLAAVVTRYLRGPEDDFEDVVVTGRPIVPQIEEYARANDLTLEDGWKVEVAKLTKARMLRAKNALQDADQYVDLWTNLFSRLE